MRKHTVEEMRLAAKIGCLLHCFDCGLIFIDDDSEWTNNNGEIVPPENDEAERSCPKCLSISITGFDIDEFEEWLESEKKTLHILATEVRRLREELSHIMEVDEQEAQIDSDKINALATSNKKLREQTQWRPMKSAPSDGKKMLLFFGIDDSIRIGHVGTCLYTDDGMKFYPTHWMPLPPAPEFRQDYRMDRMSEPNPNHPVNPVILS